MKLNNTFPCDAGELKGFVAVASMAASVAGDLKGNMNAKTLEAVRRHGKSLLLAFPNATEKDPVALCKKLRRVEMSLAKPLLDYCNGEFQDDEEGTKMDAICDKAKARVISILGMDDRKAKVTGLFVNRDPRGYALKLSEEWVRDWRELRSVNIYTDMGGYGIIAPDLTVNS